MEQCVPRSYGIVPELRYAIEKQSHPFQHVESSRALQKLSEEECMELGGWESALRPAGTW